MDVNWNKTTQENVTIKDAASEQVHVDAERKRITLGEPCNSDAGAAEAGQSEGWRLPEGVTKDDLFRLLSQYYDELKHRDTMFWKQVFAYFYATLICSVLPVIQPFGLKIPEPMPKYTFPIVGIVMAVCFFFVSIVYAKRLECVGKGYEALLDRVPEEVRRKKIEDISSFRPYQWRMAMVIPWIMFILLLAVNILFLKYYE